MALSSVLPPEPALHYGIGHLWVLRCSVWTWPCCQPVCPETDDVSAPGIFDWLEVFEVTPPTTTPHPQHEEFGTEGGWDMGVPHCASRTLQPRCIPTHSTQPSLQSVRWAVPPTHSKLQHEHIRPAAMLSEPPSTP